MEKTDQARIRDKPPEIISYYNMRRAIGVLGITLPLIMVIGSSLFGGCKEVQMSISAYYHTNMRKVTITLNWTNSNRAQFRTIVTALAKDGEQNYVW